jgi:Zn-dependent M28 family amino/carboxypeptidase
MPAPIPTLGIGLETSLFLKRKLRQGLERLRIEVDGGRPTVTTRNIVGELPGSDPDAGWIVASAHYDGHDLAQAAQDNATGTAVILETARLLAPFRSHLRAGIRFIFFSGEEMGLNGSRAYVRDHAGEIAGIRFVFNADIVGLAAPLVILTQNSPEVAAYLRSIPAEALDATVNDTRIDPYSDQFSFTMLGIPVAEAASTSPGPGNYWRHSTGDTLDKLQLRVLRQASASAARILLRIASAPGWLPKKHLEAEAVRQALVAAGLETPLRVQGRWPF